MIVNNNKEENNFVKFISYSGKYPNLCIGVLVLEINGDIVKFGHESGSYDFKTNKFKDNNYPKFWSSGGNCGFMNNYSDSYINNGEWNIDKEDIPKEYQQYANEIDEVFNNNVDFGCCGGCL